MGPVNRRGGPARRNRTTNLDESRELATLVQQQLLREVRTLYPQAEDPSLKQTPFDVLGGANMPNVLAEFSFLTNKTETAWRASDSYRDRILDALTQAILEYQWTLTPWDPVPGQLVSSASSRRVSGALHQLPVFNGPTTPASV